MQAGWWENCNAQPYHSAFWKLCVSKALDLLASVYPNLSFVNTSQSLSYMPVLTENRSHLPVLTPRVQNDKTMSILDVKYTCLKTLMIVLELLRPKGKFLVLQEGYQRYLLGREVCLLMGMPIHCLNMDTVPDAAPWTSILQSFQVYVTSPFWILHIHENLCTLWTRGFAWYGWKWDGCALHHGCNLCGHQCHRAAIDVSRWLIRFGMIWQ